MSRCIAGVRSARPDLQANLNPALVIVVIDVHYDDNIPIAGIGAVVVKDWNSAVTDAEFSDVKREFQPYVPGQFYRRELPCLLPTLSRIANTIALNTIVIDGHVDLSPGQAGLGRHLHNALDKNKTVVGIAKNPYPASHARPVFRGKSKHPLWVTCTDEKLDAAECVHVMAGDARLPTLVKAADRLARKVCRQSMPGAANGRP